MPVITHNAPNSVAPGSQLRMTQEQANSNALQELSCAFTAAGTAIATTVTKAKTVNALTYTVMGAFFSKAATDNFWTLGVAGSLTVVQAGRFQKYLLLIDNLGNASVLEATQAGTAAGVTWTNISGLSRYAPMAVALGSTKACVAVATVATDATHTFTPGTTAFNAAGITTTFVDGIDPSLVPLVANEVGNVVGNGG